MRNDIATPGPVALFGSGETSPSGRKVFDRLLRDLPSPPHLALLETPAGFELNSAQVIGRMAEFLEHRLQNYQPRISIVPARRRNSPYSPDDPEIAAPLLEADLIFMGPGSPSYAVRQLRNSVTWQYLVARHRLGATLALASAATIAISALALPVYEIYKVGEDLHWKPGLDFFGSYGLPLIFIPHWNNHDGGEELDTSRCFMGQTRFAELLALLPDQHTILGIDEKTALVLDLPAGIGRVIGLGGVTLLHTMDETCIQRYEDGETFSLMECCPFTPPQSLEGLAPQAWDLALQMQRQRMAEMNATPADETPSEEVLTLLEKRQIARANRDWSAADALREQIAQFGWMVVDTKEGPRLERLNK